ncbi:MAG: PqqD family protein [Oligoflexia bacterium]|nr:PqqD family protein [Oligoflexia bacterium]
MAKEKAVKTHKLTAKTVIKRAANVISRTNIDGTVAIMRLDEDQFFYTLDGISADLWNQFNGKANLSSLIKALSKKHPFDQKRMQKDAEKMILQLKKQKLVDLY